MDWKAISAELAQPRSEARPNPEPEEIQNLRSYSNYLSPATRSPFGGQLDAGRNLPAQSFAQLDGHHSPPGRCPNDPLDLHRGPDDESPALFVSPALARGGLRLGRCRLHGLEPALRTKCALEPDAVSHFLSLPAPSGFDPDDDFLGLVQLLRAATDRVAALRLRRAAYLGAVPLSRDCHSSRFLSDLVAPVARLPRDGIHRRHRLRCVWRRASLAGGDAAVSPAALECRTFHLLRGAAFHGALFSRDHDLRRHLEPLDR